MNLQHKTREELIIALEELQKKYDKLILSSDNDFVEHKKTESYFLTSEEKYKSLVENANVGIYTTNLKGDILFANYALCQILEFHTVDDLINTDVKSIYNDEIERDKFLEAIKKSKQVNNYELELLTQKENKIYVLVNAYITADIITGMIMDITPRKKAEVRLQDIIDLNPLSIQIVDREGFTLKVNPAHTKLFGAVPPPYFSIFDDLSVKSEELKKLILDAKSGKMVNLPDLYYNTHDVSPEFPDIPNWIRALIFPLNDCNAQPESFVLMHENITERKKMEISLKESEASLEWSQEIAKMGSWSYEILTQKNTWSKNCFKLFGVNPDEVDPTFEYFKSRVHKDDLHMIAEGIDEIIRNKKPVQMQLRIMFTDGSYKWIQNNIIPFFKDDKLQFLKGVNIDITERKLMEEALIESQANLNALFNATDDLILLVSADGILLELNDRDVDQFGKPREQLIGQKLFELLPQEIVKRRRPFFEQAIATAKVVKFEDENNGRWMVSNLYPVLDANGKVIRLAIYSRDITDRKIALDMVKESEEKYHTFINSTNDITFLKDENFRYQIINKAAIDFFERKQDEIIGFTDFELMDHLSASNCLNSDNRIINENKISVQEENVKGRIYETHKFPVKLKDGKIGIGGIIRDITERKAVEKEIIKQNSDLQRLVSEKDKFFSIISHDLRSPFNSFLGLTQIMAEELPSLTMDQLQKFAESMRKSATNLFRLLENLLEWSQIQQGTIPFNPEILDLHIVVKESTEMIMDTAEKKDLKIFYEIPTDIKVFGDNNMLQSVFRNLFSNAVKFTPVYGKIYIAAKMLSDDVVEVSIKDTGIGIRKDRIESLFSLNANSSRKGTEGELGSGLGLILCREFIEKQGGKIWIESEEGKGSSFFFTLGKN
jgi:PAS domain S-box-containing protein